MKRIVLAFLCFQPLGFAQDLTDQALDLMRKGLYDTAEENLRSLETNDPLRLRLLIELAERRGDTPESERLAEILLGQFHNRSFQTPDDLSQAAFAAWHLDRWEQANQIYLQASQLDAAPLSLFVDWGRLYLEKYNPVEAEGIFRDALRSPDGERPRWGRGHAFLGLAEALGEQGKLGAENSLDEAAQDPRCALELLVFQLDLSLKEENWSRASELIEKGMGLNAAYLPLLRLNCAFSYLQDDPEGFSKALEKLSEINPRDAVLYEWLGDVEVRRRRLEVAILQYDEALRLDPERWSALASKGINLLRLGREREGAAALEVAYENDPYNIWTVNTLRLLDSFRRFDRSETDHFSVRLHQDESLALRAYVEGLLERCLSALEERYNHKIEGRVVFEMYPDHDDFAVRTLGLPGLGALGATFGKVVAMDSPSARPPGEFHWASTLWHEVAHVVTLSLSKSRVPRWFTEGLSMMEERLAGRGWGEGLSVSFVRAFEAGKLLPLSELNSGFVRPRYPEQLSVSYYQAGWVCELLVREFGMSKICEMLTRYGEGQKTEEVFEAVLGRSVAEVDRQFQQELSRHLSPLVPRLAEPEAILKDPEQLKAAVRAQPENFFLNLALGRRLAETGAVSDGVQYLEKAVELFPSFVGQQSPYAVLAILYRKQERTEDEIRIRRSWWHQSPLFVDNALRLAELLADSGELVEASSILEEAMYVDPLSEDAHRRLGSLYLELGEPKKAAGEFLALLGLNPTNRAEAHYHLANALYQSGSHIAAKREVLLALEKAPGWEQAQQLLLEIVRR